MDELLTLKIFRLSCPTIENRFWDYLCPRQILEFGDINESVEINEFKGIKVKENYALLDGTHALMLPTEQEIICAGETFQGYINLCNTSNNDALHVKIQINVSSSDQKVMIFDNTSEPVENIPPGGVFGFTISHHITKSSMYQLLCTVSYSSRVTAEISSFKRCFRFHASSPFDITHRIKWLTDFAIVEFRIKNNKSFSVFLIEAFVEINNDFSCSMLNFENTENKKYQSKGLHSFRPQELYTLLFSIKPNSPGIAKLISLREAQSIGQLLLKWKTSKGGFGISEPYYLNTKDVFEPDFVYIKVSSFPSNINVGDPFEVKLEFFNTSVKSIDLSIKYDYNERGPFFPLGSEIQWVGKLDKGSSVISSIHLICLTQGIHPLDGILAYDAVTNTYSKPKALCDLFVL